MCPSWRSIPQGNAVAVWERYDGSNEIVQSAIRPAGSGWQAPVDLSAAGQDAYVPQLAFDPQGNAVAVWMRSNGSEYIAQAAGYDAAGPQLNALSIPATGTVGQPVSFSVSPLDVWSALGSTGWSFGDGGSASGTSAGHTYAAPGTYQVTLTSADALGNATSASGTIAIRPAPPCASVARVVPVKGGKALLKLKARGAGRCRGVAKLIARKGRKRLLIGKSAFSIPAGKTRTVRIKLTAKAKALLRKAGQSGLKARFSGRGVKSRIVVLKPE